jgi:hypothetical protein
MTPAETCARLGHPHDKLVAVVGVRDSWRCQRCGTYLDAASVVQVLLVRLQGSDECIRALQERVRALEAPRNREVR